MIHTIGCWDKNLAVFKGWLIYEVSEQTPYFCKPTPKTQYRKNWGVVCRTWYGDEHRSRTDSQDNPNPWTNALCVQIIVSLFKVQFSTVIPHDIKITFIHLYISQCMSYKSISHVVFILFMMSLCMSFTHVLFDCHVISHVVCTFLIQLSRHYPSHLFIEH